MQTPTLTLEYAQTLTTITKPIMARRQSSSYRGEGTGSADRPYERDGNIETSVDLGNFKHDYVREATEDIAAKLEADGFVKGSELAEGVYTIGKRYREKEGDEDIAGRVFDTLCSPIKVQAQGKTLTLIVMSTEY